MAVPTIKAKAKTREVKVMSTGARYPWVVYHVAENGFHYYEDSFVTEVEADRYMAQNVATFRGLVKVHVVIPPMEY